MGTLDRAMLTYLTPRQALEAVGPDRRIVASPGCGEPTTLLGALADEADRLMGSELYSGMLLGDYPFMDAVRAGVLKYATWHVMPRVRDAVVEGFVRFYPVRSSQVPALLQGLAVNTAFIRVSPPDRHGFCSLGPTASYPVHAVKLAQLVIAEIDEAVPRTHGEGNIHISQIDIAVESQHPMPEFSRVKADDISRSIARYLLELLPLNPTIQVGIGAIPEAFVEGLRSEGVAGLKFVGMAIDGMAELYDDGLLATGVTVPYPPIFATELMGTRRLMEFANENPVVSMYASSVSTNVRRFVDVDHFVSVNSAIEVDLGGQVNSEWARHCQLTGIGGSADFFEYARNSEGGVRIIAMPSTNRRDGSSKIVKQLMADSPVTIPRHSVEYVVTEYGIAMLELASDRERAEALTAIAHPAHRASLSAS